MKSDQVESALIAAAKLIKEDLLVVIGSQAIHAAYPDPAKEIVLMSDEVDVYLGIYPSPRDRQLYYFIHEQLGSDSGFHEQNGFYVDAVKQGAVPIFPSGWLDRTLLKNLPWSTAGDRVTNKIGHVRFIEIHDLVASKLAAFRAKDKMFAEMTLGTPRQSRWSLRALGTSLRRRHSKYRAALWGPQPTIATYLDRSQFASRCRTGP